MKKIRIFLIGLLFMQSNFAFTQLQLQPPTVENSILLDTIFLELVPVTPSGKVKHPTVYSGGLKLEANMSSYKMLGMSSYASNLPRAGASLGGFAMFELGKYFAFQLECMFNWHNNINIISNVPYKGYVLNVDVPLYAVVQKYLPNLDRIYIGMGPTYTIGFCAMHDGVNLYDKQNWSTEYDIHHQRWDIGASVIIGYEFMCGAQINLRYHAGFMNTLASSATLLTEPCMQQQNVNFGLGFRF